MTARVVAHHRRLMRRPNEAAVLLLNEVAVLRLIAVRLRQNAEVVHQRNADAVPVRYRGQRHHANSRVTIGASQRRVLNVQFDRSSSGHRQNAFRDRRRELNDRHRLRAWNVRGLSRSEHSPLRESSVRRDRLRRDRLRGSSVPLRHRALSVHGLSRSSSEHRLLRGSSNSNGQ